MTLETERLILREFSAADFEAVHRYSSDENVVRHEPWGPNTPHETRDYLERAEKMALYRPRFEFSLAVVVRETGELIGGCSLRNRHFDHDSASLGYAFNALFWGRGYATEAAQALIAFGFRELGLHRIWATCSPENAASLRLLRGEVLCRGAWRDSFILGLLVEDWVRLSLR
jgi:RimJ/RimL family protein N-acetyltransferase